MKTRSYIFITLLFLAGPVLAQPTDTLQKKSLGPVVYAEFNPFSLVARAVSGNDQDGIDVAGAFGESYGVYFDTPLVAFLRFRVGGLFYNKTPFFEGYRFQFVSPSVGVAARLGSWDARIPFTRRVFGRRTFTAFFDVMHADLEGDYECFLGCQPGREESNFAGRRTLMSVGFIGHTVFRGGGLVMNSTVGLVIGPGMDGTNTSATPRISLGIGWGDWSGR